MADDFSQSIINVDDIVSPAILAGLVNRNVSYLYQLVQSGRLPVLTQSTYREVIHAYIDDLTKGVEAKLEKAKLEQEAKLVKLEADKQIKLEKARLAEETAAKLAQAREDKKTKSRLSFESDGDDSIHPLMAAKLKQNIKTERAREEQIIQKNAIERREYIDASELLELTEDFIMAISNNLDYIANTWPETQKKIDESKEELQQLGITMLAEADLDSKSYVQAMLDREFDEDDVRDIEDGLDEN